jgi:protein-tyrosine phosphatase
VLICDPTGISTSAALMCAYLMIRKQVRMEDFIAVCAERRPSVSMSLSMRRGLDQLQRTMDEKKMKRLDAKVRNSTMLSVGF